jgi:carboxylesterase type B
MVGEESSNTVGSLVIASNDPCMVLHPASTTCEDKLSVLIWIYGGGLYAGTAADPQYNLQELLPLGSKLAS